MRVHRAGLARPGPEGDRRHGQGVLAGAPQRLDDGIGDGALGGAVGGAGDEQAPHGLGSPIGGRHDIRGGGAPAPRGVAAPRRPVAARAFGGPGVWAAVPAAKVTHMAALETPPAAERPANGRHTRSARPMWAGDDAVPRGLAVASAVTLRVAIVVGGVVLLGLFAQRMMLVVLPLIIAVLLTTLLAPAARWLERRRFRPGLAAGVVVLGALLAFLGLWGMIIPPVVTQVPDVVESVQRGAVQVAEVTRPIGLTPREVESAIDKTVSDLQGGKVADQVLTGALLLTQWIAATILILVLTFFFVKDGGTVWSWIVSLFADHRRAALDEVGERAWGALASYVQGVFLVATIDAVLIGAALLIVGVPLALPLIVLTFLAAFFPIVGSVAAGVVAVLVALVSKGVPAAVVILAAIIVVQQLEGNVFYPIVMGRRLRLHPVAILLALTAGGVLAGVAGAFLAIPLAAVTAAVLDFMRERRSAQRSHAVVAPP